MMRRRIISQRHPETEEPATPPPVPPGTPLDTRDKPLYAPPVVPSNGGLQAIKAFPHLDRVVQARVRTFQQDEAQLSWKASRAPTAMLEALRRANKVLVPPAYWLSSARDLLRECVGGNDPGPNIRLAFSVAARSLYENKMLEAVGALAHARVVLTRFGPDPILAGLAEIIRRTYPDAPPGWSAGPPSVPTGSAPAPAPAQTSAPAAKPRPPAQVKCLCGATGKPLPDSSRPEGWRPPLGWAMDAASGGILCARCRQTPGAESARK